MDMDTLIAYIENRILVLQNVFENANASGRIYEATAALNGLTELQRVLERIED